MREGYPGDTSARHGGVDWDRIHRTARVQHARIKLLLTRHCGLLVNAPGTRKLHRNMTLPGTYGHFTKRRRACACEVRSCLIVQGSKVLPAIFLATPPTPRPVLSPSWPPPGRRRSRSPGRLNDSGQRNASPALPQLQGTAAPHRAVLLRHATPRHAMQAGAAAERGKARGDDGAGRGGAGRGGAGYGAEI